jgi:hypothetical protein
MDHLNKYSSLDWRAPPLSHGDFIATPRKQASWNSCKNLSTIQRPDQELWTSWTSTLVRPDETPPASPGDFIATPRKQASWNSCNNLSTTQRSDQELRTLKPVILSGPWCGPTTRWRCRVAIFMGRQGKQPSKTPVKIWVRSNGRIKSYGPLEEVLYSGLTRHLRRLNQKSLRKTTSLQTQKSSLETSSTTYNEIFTAHRLLQNQKSLTKTMSLHTRKSSPEPSSPPEAEIFSTPRLVQN